MILTMTTVGYGEIYPSSILGRVFTIMAVIWGAFNMSMIIVTLTNQISFNSEEEQAYNEICDLDEVVVNKKKEDAAVLIQAMFRYVYSKGDVKHVRPPADFKTRLRTRLEFVAVLTRSKYRRLNIENANPQLNEIIGRLQATVINFLESGMKKMSIYKNQISRQVSEVRQNQFKMDAKALKMLDVTMRLNSFLVNANKNEDIEGEQFNKTKELYGPNKKKLSHNMVRDFHYLFNNARSPTNDFYEQFLHKDEKLHK